ncbi:MAG: molybdopterin-guanine dinucleotide biosynthesis protein B, partial [Candidatus Margulisiibacteriota bacterium]
MTPPILSIAGHSNSGKTTLIERLIPELSRLGYRVGTIKHDAHNFVMDHEGKDTWRMSQAGAQTVVIASATQMAM